MSEDWNIIDEDDKSTWPDEGEYIKVIHTQCAGMRCQDFEVRGPVFYKRGKVYIDTGDAYYRLRTGREWLPTTSIKTDQFGIPKIFRDKDQ